MDTKILEKIGLTTGEVRVYLSLLELGITSTGKIISKSQITSSKVYVILERLEKRGLVSHIIKNNVKYFQASDPKRILDYMDERKKEIDTDKNKLEELIPELSQKRKLQKENQDTTMFEGFKGIETAMFEFIENLSSGNEYVVFGTKEPLDEKFEILIRRFYQEKAKKKISTRLIYNEEYKEILKLYKGIPLTEVRFVKTLTPSTIVISKNKVLIITYEKESKAVLIESKQIADSFLNFFESMWKIAKP
ncbi:MAG: helix-turn-helix domain-containing protein [Candidatus Pacearchaeota archaeon]|jgi:sugar-specific transcriptional regulator TrmB